MGSRNELKVLLFHSTRNMRATHRRSCSSGLRQLLAGLTQPSHCKSCISFIKGRHQSTGTFRQHLLQKQQWQCNFRGLTKLYCHKSRVIIPLTTGKMVPVKFIPTKNIGLLLRTSSLKDAETLCSPTSKTDQPKVSQVGYIWQGEQKGPSTSVRSDDHSPSRRRESTCPLQRAAA